MKDWSKLETERAEYKATCEKLEAEVHRGNIIIGELHSAKGKLENQIEELRGGLDTREDFRELVRELLRTRPDWNAEAVCHAANVIQGWNAGK